MARQSDVDFSIILVDNASSDGSPNIARAFAARIDVPSTAVVVEHQKGTGAAATRRSRGDRRGGDARGAHHADGDPDRDWIRNLKRAMYDEGLEFVAGKIRPREDEGTMTLADRFVLPGMIWLAENFGRIHRRGPQFKYPYFMAAGNNLAITAELYVRSGGFPRTAIEHAHEDRVLSETARTLTTRAGVRRDVVVYKSVRRVRATGYIDTLRWYRNHGNRPDVVDIR